MFSPLIHVLPFLSLCRHYRVEEVVSDHGLLCDFPSSRCTLSVLKVYNRCTDTPCTTNSDSTNDSSSKTENIRNPCKGYGFGP
ncbi:hypothetical protein TNCV_888331 [Trichonephila clavipes]|nr:hypothetical protein TNCV_888331 [Trichonephila clavipes]